MLLFSLAPFALQTTMPRDENKREDERKRSEERAFREISASKTSLASESGTVKCHLLSHCTSITSIDSRGLPLHGPRRRGVCGKKPKVKRKKKWEKDKYFRQLPRDCMRYCYDIMYRAMVPLAWCSLTRRSRTLFHAQICLAIFHLCVRFLF